MRCDLLDSLDSANVRRFESRRKSLLHALLTMFLSSDTSLSNVHKRLVIIFYKFVTFSSNLPSNRFVQRTTFFGTTLFGSDSNEEIRASLVLASSSEAGDPFASESDAKNASKASKWSRQEAGTVLDRFVRTLRSETELEGRGFESRCRIFFLYFFPNSALISATNGTAWIFAYHLIPRR